MQYHITEIRQGIWLINENGLDAIYMIKGSRRGLVVDTGTGIADLKMTVEQYLGQPYDVVLTHGHVDHAGGISQFDKVFVHHDDIEMADHLILEDRQDYIRRMNSAGVSDADPNAVPDILKSGDKPQYCEIKTGDVFDLGDRTLKVMECPGHTAGSICLADEADNLIFTGDNLNDLELISAPAHDRMELLSRWYEAARHVLDEQQNAELCCGGHSVFSIEKAREILECGRKVLDHEIEMERMHIHIFTGNFARYKNSCLTVDEHLQGL